MVAKTVISLGAILAGIIIIILIFQRFKIGDLLNGAVEGTGDFFKNISDQVSGNISRT